MEMTQENTSPSSPKAQLSSAQPSAFMLYWSIATGLLASMAITFVLSKTLLIGYPYASLLSAFSEAALVGALADWFAVTALFRHPLGIPIPHTAIVPRNKKRIAESFGTFVDENFLNAQLIEERLKGKDLVTPALNWCLKEKNAILISERIRALLPALESAVKDKQISGYLGSVCIHKATEISWAPLLGKMVQAVISGDEKQVLSDELLSFVGKLVEDNKLFIKDRVKKETPWFFPEFIDNKIYQKIVDELRQMLVDIRHDQNHPIRIHLRKNLEEMAGTLGTNPRFAQIEAAFKKEVLSSPRFQEALADLLSMFVNSIGNHFISTPYAMLPFLQEFGNLIKENKNLIEQLNQWIKTAAAKVVVELRAEIKTFISETMERWDTKTLVEKCEQALGKDLQFIRINGTVVGGLIGVLLFYLERYLVG